MLRVYAPVVGGRAGYFQAVVRERYEGPVAVGDGYGFYQAEDFALGVLLNGFGLLYEVYEKLCRPVENRGLGGVHLHRAVVDAHAGERAEDMLYGMELGVP